MSSTSPLVVSSPRTGALAGTRAASHARVIDGVGLRRALLVIGLVLSVAAAVVVAGAIPGPLRDAGLVRLMRGMALIKGAIVLGASAVLAWRIGRPISAGLLAGYLGGAWAMAFATTLIWQLAAIAPSAIAFHAGELTLLALAWRDSRPTRRA
jgi:hypothetical protein